MTSLVRGLRTAGALALLWLLCLPAIALGHAELVESVPADGGTISEPPYVLIAEYSEPLGTDRSRIIVRDSTGAEVARGGISDEDPHVMIVDLTGVARGDYTARWTAVTPADNGVTRGTIEFSIVAQASPSPSASVSPLPTATDGPTGAPSPTRTAPPSPTSPPSLVPTPSPTPTDGEPTVGTSDLLVALLLAAALIAGLVLFIWRRRAA